MTTGARLITGVTLLVLLTSATVVVADPGLLLLSPPTVQSGEPASYTVALTDLEDPFCMSLEVTYSTDELEFLHSPLNPAISRTWRPGIALRKVPGTLGLDIVLKAGALEWPDTLELCNLNFVAMDSEADPPTITVVEFVGTEGVSPSSRRPELPKQPLIAPESFVLVQNRPNPFNPATQISFELPTRSAVSIRLFDITGREVITILAEEVLPAGAHTYTWDGRDKTGRAAPAGVYFSRVEAGDWSSTMKMILVR